MKTLDIIQGFSRRYLPPKEAVQQCYNAFGIRVGLGDNWEDIYDGWNKEMK